jgi:hypothetical protein
VSVHLINLIVYQLPCRERCAGMAGSASDLAGRHALKQPGGSVQSFAGGVVWAARLSLARVGPQGRRPGAETARSEGGAHSRRVPPPGRLRAKGRG